VKHRSGKRRSGKRCFGKRSEKCRSTLFSSYIFAFTLIIGTCRCAVGIVYHIIISNYICIYIGFCICIPTVPRQVKWNKSRIKCNTNVLAFHCRLQMYLGPIWSNHVGIYIMPRVPHSELIRTYVHTYQHM
jgi:hypothetical protein